MSTPQPNPWPALWALVIGFFMILVDTTIVSVANPAIMHALNTDINMVIWATSAYLLAYAVPLLVSGRMGDRYGQKRIYLIGLVIFTLASAACGLAPSIEVLIVARAFKGIGAALMSPQTMAVITRTFPPAGRGTAMGIWGAVAGVAMLVGPILGGVLVSTVGWEWIFFVNVPVGVVAFIAAWKLVPNLEASSRKLDWFGVVLSGIGLFLLVFGIQEGSKYQWGAIAGWLQVWHIIALGIAFLIVFVLWQAHTRMSPLVPLTLFRDRNFSLANLAIGTIGLTVTSQAVPMMFFMQLVLGMNPAQAALLVAPTAIISGIGAPFAGRLVDRTHPRNVAFVGLSSMLLALIWYAYLMNQPNMNPLIYLLPAVLAGVANAAMWSPVSTSANRNLPLHQAGAGAGVYNTTRQVGSVLGAAAVASLIQARLQHYLGNQIDIAELQRSTGQLDPSLHDGFSSAMAQAMLLPAVAIGIGAILVLFFQRPATHPQPRRSRHPKA